MTTLQIQSAQHFQASVTEDPMELTSDMDQRTGAGDDIDIDLDLTDDNPQDEEDDFMGEEDMNALADLTSPHAANDDEMADDSYAQGQVDEGSSIRDEDIEDVEYIGPELDEDTIVEPGIDHPNEQSEELLANYEAVSGDQNAEQEFQEEEYNEQENHEHLTTPETESNFIERELPNGQPGLANPNYVVAKEATGETSHRHDIEVSKEGKVTYRRAYQTSEPSDVEGLIAPEVELEQVGEEALPASLDQEVVILSNVEGSHTQGEDHLNSPAHLHAVVLDYQGDEMFLFPPVDQKGEHIATFLLTDEQLAYSNFGKLLEACRGVLKGSLSEQDELTVSIDDLDLHISESAIESASTTLSEIVDLYVRLQQNDGLENPPPLYMDLISRNRFPRRIDVLRNALIEGKGLSELKSSQETEDDQQHSTEGETDPSSRTAGLSSNETSTPEQQPGEEAEESIDHHDLHSDPLPAENILLRTDSAAQGAQPYPIADVAHDEHDRTEPPLGSEASPHEAENSDEFFSEAIGFKDSLNPSQPLARESGPRKAEASIVDDGDFIDYEDVEALERGASSASSTLQGDAIDENAVQDHGVLNEPIIASNPEHRSPHGVQENAVADKEVLNNLVDEKNTTDVGIPVDEEHPNFTDITSQDSDDKGQSLSGLFNEGAAPEKDQGASIPQKTEIGPKGNTDNDQHEAASTQYKDDAGSYGHDTLHEHPAQTEGDAYPVADTDFDGEIEDYSSTHPFQTESSGSGKTFGNDDQRRVIDIEVEDELEEADKSLANDDNDHVPEHPHGVNTRPWSVPESAQTQEDDDEITYEDEQDDTELPQEPAKAEHNVATSPGSLKRARSLDEDGDAMEDDLQGAKRVRSG